MALSKDFAKDVVKLIHAHLAEFGFQKRDAGIATLKLSDEAFGWIGLNKAVFPREGSMTINPVVGVRNQRIEKLEAELCGGPFSDYVPPTLAGNIGYIAPEDNYHTFAFSSEKIETIVDELVGYVAKHGVPFMKKNADLATLVKSMQTPTLRLGNSDLTYRLPAGLFLLGRFDEAQAILKRELEKIAGRTDAATLRYQKFAAGLNEQMKQISHPIL